MRTPLRSECDLPDGSSRRVTAICPPSPLYRRSGFPARLTTGESPPISGVTQQNRARGRGCGRRVEYPFWPFVYENTEINHGLLWKGITGLPELSNETHQGEFLRIKPHALTSDYICQTLPGRARPNPQPPMWPRASGRVPAIDTCLRAPLVVCHLSDLCRVKGSRISVPVEGFWILC